MVTGHGNNICILVVDVLTSIFFVYSRKLFITEAEKGQSKNTTGTHFLETQGYENLRLSFNDPKRKV